MQEPSVPSVVDSKRGRASAIRRSAILPAPDTSGNVAELSLTSTAKHFVSKLSDSDRKQLQSTLQGLNGKCIKVGTTCSGTDVAIPVLECTFRALCEMFQAPFLGLQVDADRIYAKDPTSRNTGAVQWSK